MSDTVYTDTNPSPGRRRNSKNFEPPNMSGDSGSEDELKMELKRARKEVKMLKDLEPKYQEKRRVLNEGIIEADRIIYRLVPEHPAAVGGAVAVASSTAAVVATIFTGGLAVIGIGVGVGTALLVLMMFINNLLTRLRDRVIKDMNDVIETATMVNKRIKKVNETLSLGVVTESDTEFKNLVEEIKDNARGVLDNIKTTGVFDERFKSILGQNRDKAAKANLIRECARDIEFNINLMDGLFSNIVKVS